MQSTLKLVENAARVLSDPDTPPLPADVAAPLAQLLGTLAENNRLAGIDVDKIPGARETAVAVLALEHAAVTA